jgi:hypothetical protein
MITHKVENILLRFPLGLEEILARVCVLPYGRALSRSMTHPNLMRFRR